MPRRRPVVANASPLILLGRTGHLPLLEQLFHEVLVPAPVMAEILAGGSRPGAAAVEAAARSLSLVVQPVRPTALLKRLASVVDPGEASALALAVAERARVVLMDDRVGRRLASHLGLRPLGTAGILLLAVRRGIVTSLPPVLRELEAAGLRLSASVRKRLLAAARRLR